MAYLGAYLGSLLGGGATATPPDSLLRRAVRARGLLAALVDAAMGAVNDLGGRSVTRLSAPLSASEVDVMGVESTLRFGEPVDGTGGARICVGTEIIEATYRTSTVPYGFGTLTRGVDGTAVVDHQLGEFVIDLSENTSAVDRFKRGLFVGTAIGGDLDVIARNHGLRKPPGLSEEQWRRLIKVMSYMPRQTIVAFELVLEAYFDSLSVWDITERPVTNPWTTFVRGTFPFENDPIGSFYVGGSEQVVTTGLQAVVTDHNVGPLVDGVLGVYPVTAHTLLGARSGPGIVDYFSGGGSYTPGSPNIVLGSSPGPIGTPVLVDYRIGAEQNWHYLATNDLVRADLGDPWPYLADPLAALQYLLDTVRAAGTIVVLSPKA